MAAGLALTVGVERALPQEGRDHGGVAVALVLFAFVATLVPFYHGALRHLDTQYLHGPQVRQPQWVFFGDFMFLFVEACLLVTMAASVARPESALTAWLLLLLLDIVWLFFVVEAGRRPRSIPIWHDYGWAVVNVPFLVLGAALALVSEQNGLATAAVVSFLLVARTAADYAWNWNFYFPNSAPADEPMKAGVAVRE